MKNNLIFIGAGGHAKVLYNIVLLAGHKLKAVFDIDKTIKHFYDVKNELYYDQNKYKGFKIVIAIGDVKIRKKLHYSIKHEFFSLSHPSSIIDRQAIIKEGAQLLQGSIVNCNSVIGLNSIINTNASVDHDCSIGNFVHIAPGVTICGGVKIGNGTFVGANSTIIENCVIGSNVIIGAGSVVTSNIPDNVTVVGSPARIIKSN